MARAEHYFEKLMSLPQDVLSNGLLRSSWVSQKLYHYAGKNQFDESDRYFNDFFEFVKVAPTCLSMENWT